MPLRINIYPKIDAFAINSVTLARMKDSNIRQVIFMTLDQNSFRPVKDIRTGFRRCGMNVSWIRLRLTLRRLVKEGHIERAPTVWFNSCFRPGGLFRLTKIS